MYFLILKKKKQEKERERARQRVGEEGQEKTKGYTDMYVQPNIGTLLKQAISTSENRL